MMWGSLSCVLLVDKAIIRETLNENNTGGLLGPPVLSTNSMVSSTLMSPPTRKDRVHAGPGIHRRGYTKYPPQDYQSLEAPVS